jgi:two-component system alkaline phosphatase synthesis response regulator PhoP
MEPLLVFPERPPPQLLSALEEGGYPYLAVGDAEEAARKEPADGWGGAVVWSGENEAPELSFCGFLRRREEPVAPVLLLVSPAYLEKAAACEDIDDFVLSDARPSELSARLGRLFRRRREGAGDLIVYGPLALNLETYQAAISGRPLDLTFMEYELLKFLAAHPGKVFTRETLLSRVWGYEYFGGARTVDVHVRRLRAKLGEEHAHLIETVRSVGYRFGTVRWLPGSSS